MTDPSVGVDVSGGQIQGIVGAGSVVIENLTFYARAPEEPVQSASAESIGPCPYPGLAYFGPDDAKYFFGRDAAIARLEQAVAKQSFTALMGASGSGKSSVVLAGLAPRLNQTGNWRFSHFRVGTELDANPFLALARALAPLYVASESDVERLKNTKLLAASLEAGELTLRDVFADTRSRNKGRRILLIADQFEEVFTSVADEAVRTRFIDALLAGFPDPAAGGVPDICLILTMRADFYGRALRHRPLADALQGHVENLGPMNREELQTAIIQPAQDADVAFEAGVVETLLDTVESKPGGLPLLQFALREMWGRQERKKITRKSYDEIGGVEGALAQRAETVFAGLTRNDADPAMDKAFQRLFTRLVTLGEGQEDTRRVVERTELGEDVWGLAQRLAGEENRLVVTNASTARETAEVVHEALIRHWPRLVDWINRDRAFQSWLRQIRLNIELWSAAPDDEGPLLRGGMLAQGTEWLARRRDDLSDKERAYIEASVALRQRLEAEKEAARQAEIKRQQELAEAAGKLAEEQRQRAKVALRWGGAAAAAALIAAIGLGFALYARHEANLDRMRAQKASADADAAAVVARQERGRAEVQQRLATARLLATEARIAFTSEQSGDDVQRSLLLAAASLRSAWTQEGFEAWSEAIKLAPPRPSVVVDSDQGPFTHVTLSPDGSMIAAAGKDAIFLIDPKTFKPIDSLPQPGAVKLTFSPPRGELLAASVGRKVHLWSVAERKLVNTVPATGERFDISSIAFDPAGKRLAYAGSNYYARLFETDSWSESAKDWSQAAQIKHEATTAVLFSPDGHWLLTGGTRLTAWDVGTLSSSSGTDGAGGSFRSVALPQVARASFLAFTHDGRRLITTESIWWVEQSDSAEFRLGEKVPFDGYVVAISMDDSMLATSGHTVWTTEGKPREVARIPGSARRSSVAFDPSSRWLLRTGDQLERWDVASGAEFAQLEHDAEVVTFAADPNTRHVATTTADGYVHIWKTGERASDWTKVRALEVNKREGEWHGSNVAFSSDGRWLAASSENVLKIFATNDWREVMRREQKNNVSNIAFSPDGRWLIAVSADQDFDSIDVIAVDSGQVTSIADVAQVNKAHAVSLSPDGSWLAVKTNPECWPTRGTERFFPGVIRVWQIATRQRVASMPLGIETLTKGCGQDPTIGTPPEPPSGKIELAKDALNWKSVVVGATPVVVIESPDRHWRVQRAPFAGGMALQYQDSRAVTLPHPGKLNDLAFLPNGRWLITTSDDGRARVWALNRDDMIAAACMRLKENLSEKDWRNYLGDEPYAPICPGLPTPKT